VRNTDDQPARQPAGPADTPADALRDLPLREFRPRAEVYLPAHQVPRPRFPAIDAHNHLGKDGAANFATRDPRDLVALLDEVGVETMVDLDGGWGEALDARIARYGRAFPGRFVHFVRMDSPHGAGGDLWSAALATADPGAYAAGQLRDAVRRGARGLKVWKDFGLSIHDAGGALLPVDDARLDPLWSAAGELGVPVLIHVGDPAAFFQPLDATNERLEQLIERPEWHFYPGYPSLEEIIGQLERLVLRHPATTFIGAHVGCYAENLARVGALLDRAPNYHVDVSARHAELGRQPRVTQAFIAAHPDRVLFGTDNLAFNRAMYPIWYRFLETEDDYFSYRPDPDDYTTGRWRIYGLGLPDELLRAVYRDNARRVLRL
jgi:predicted TIM-barrel fold metal-dependent hydrolase